MISTAPTVATYPVPGIYQKVTAYITTAKAMAVDGLTWVEFGELLVALLRLVIQTLDEVAGMTGAQKKAAVVESAGLLFDAIADRAVPLAAWPIWILVRPAVRSLVLALAAGAVEPILQLSRS